MKGIVDLQVILEKKKKNGGSAIGKNLGLWRGMALVGEELQGK